MRHLRLLMLGLFLKAPGSGHIWITPADVQTWVESLVSTRQICVQAVPWINDNRGPEIVAIITGLTVLSTIAVVLRIMARRISKIKLGVEDYLIIVALVSCSGKSLCTWHWENLDLGVWSDHHSIHVYVSCEKLSSAWKGTYLPWTAVQNGFGRHMLMLDLPEIIAFTKVSNPTVHQPT